MMNHINITDVWSGVFAIESCKWKNSVLWAKVSEYIFIDAIPGLS